jgi:hypothetical protein
MVGAVTGWGLAMRDFDLTRCAICGRAFTPRTGNTFWVADANRKLLGVAHLRCQRRRGAGYLRVWINRGASLDNLRFIIWHFARGPHRRGSVEMYAGILIEEGPPSDEPTNFQARMLAYWSRPGSEVGAEMAEAAWRRYRELVAEFRADEAARVREGQREPG